MIGKIVAEHPYWYILVSGLPYFAATLFDAPIAWYIVVGWTLTRLLICIPSMRRQRQDTARRVARYGPMPDRG